jgi:hypothetical protein
MHRRVVPREHLLDDRQHHPRGWRRGIGWLTHAVTCSCALLSAAIPAASPSGATRMLDQGPYSGIKRWCARSCRRRCCAATLTVRLNPFSPGGFSSVILVSVAPRKACPVTGLRARSLGRKVQSLGGDAEMLVHDRPLSSPFEADHRARLPSRGGSRALTLPACYPRI